MIIKYYFKINELRALGRLLERQYIDYEDSEAHEVVNKLFRIIKENDSNTDHKELAR